MFQSSVKLKVLCQQVMQAILTENFHVIASSFARELSLFVASFQLTDAQKLVGEKFGRTMLVCRCP